MIKGKIKYYLFVTVAFLLLLPSCMTSEEINYFQTLNIPYPKEHYKKYRLSIDDQIRCAIYTKNTDFSATFNSIVGTDENSGSTYTIHHNGSILLPYFGEIKIVGMTLEEAEEYIQAKMQESILDVQVNLNLENNFFYVLSDRGSKRGEFEIYKENMTIYQALAQVGSADMDLDYRSVKILRKDTEGNTYVKSFDLRTKDVIQSEFYYIQPNDMLYFATSRNSFFNIRSLGSFVSTILTPLSILILASSYKTN